MEIFKVGLAQLALMGEPPLITNMFQIAEHKSAEWLKSVGPEFRKDGSKGLILSFTRTSPG